MKDAKHHDYGYQWIQVVKFTKISHAIDEPGKTMCGWEYRPEIEFTNNMKSLRQCRSCIVAIVKELKKEIKSDMTDMNPPPAGEKE